MVTGVGVFTRVMSFHLRGEFFCILRAETCPSLFVFDVVKELTKLDKVGWMGAWEFLVTLLSTRKRDVLRWGVQRQAVVPGASTQNKVRQRNRSRFYMS